MSIKNKILQILEENKGKNISGQELADMLNVSRTSVWKAISSLKEEGYIIDAISNKGYALSSASDVLSAEGIKLFLNEKYKDLSISVHKTLPSTNTEAKAAAVNNASHGTVIISEEQTKGRGRFGRDFFSPANSGIYMSIILKPTLNISDAVLVTTATAVAVCEAIDLISDVKTKIKWVNDIYLNDKKVCGILTEAVTNFESGDIESIIVGIGINVKTKKEDFPDEIQEKAGSIFLEENFFNRNKLSAEIINNVLTITENLGDKKFLVIYKERSMIIGEYILYNRNNEWLEGFALDIDDSGGLIIINKDKKQETLHSGEVSIRKRDY